MFGYEIVFFLAKGAYFHTSTRDLSRVMLALLLLSLSIKYRGDSSGST